MMAGKRRANNEGSVYQRGNGTYAARLVLPDGQRRDFYARTKQEALTKLRAARRAHDDGLPAFTAKQTVGTYLAGWLAGARPALKPRTWQRYEQFVRLYAAPALGTIPLTALTPADLRELYAARLEAGASSTTVHQLHAVLHRALEQAYRDGLSARNVADLVKAPRPAGHEMQTLTPEQARSLLTTAADERLEALYVLALHTGARQGELLALRWPDVELDAGSLNVRGTMQRTKDGLRIESPKTAGSRRRVSLTRAATEALRRHRLAQNAERLKLGAAWDDNGLVFANELGRPIEAGNLLRRSFWPLLAKAGLPRIRFHDLRHTAATLMLGKGVHPKIASEMLGHSKIGITLDLYSHVTPTMQRQAVDALDAVFAG
jgi:integrase